MRTATKRLYEGMFLVDSALAGSDWDGVIGEIQRILGRGGAEIVSMRKWDERKLEYDIKKKSRGTYILTYFNISSDKIGGIERDVQLSELILRVLILRGDHLTPEVMEQETPAMAAERQAELEAAEAAAATESPTKAETAEADVEASDETPADEDDDAETTDEADEATDTDDTDDTTDTDESDDAEGEDKPK